VHRRVEVPTLADQSQLLEPSQVVQATSGLLDAIFLDGEHLVPPKQKEPWEAIGLPTSEQGESFDPDRFTGPSLSRSAALGGENDDPSSG
jgi:hypothetical protein